MKRLLSLFALATLTVSAWAVKAVTSPLRVTLVDGTTITAYLHGDEDLSWVTDEQGRLLTAVGQRYAVASETPAAFVARHAATRQANMARRVAIDKPGRAYFPHTGTPRALVILAEFSDTTFTVADPKATFEAYLNSREPLQDLGHREDRNYGSVAQYFSDMSGGTFVPQFDVVGPVTLDQPSAYYGEDNGTQKDIHIGQFVRDACMKVDDMVDFADYDSNGDGFVDLVYIIYAGWGQSNSAVPGDLWPKSGSTTIAAVGGEGGEMTFDGKHISRYGISNELNYNYYRKLSSAPARRVNGIGTFCHEFSHTLGLPDLYELQSRATNNSAMEYWDLMDNGNNVDNSYTPVPYSLWEKSVMGWETVDSLQHSVDAYTLPAGKSIAISGAADHEKQLFVLTNFQNEGWASKMIGHGLLVSKVDYPYNKVNFNDRPNMIDYPRLTIVPADGELLSSYVVSEQHDGGPTQEDYQMSFYGDPFPGESGRTALAFDDGLPNFFWGTPEAPTTPGFSLSDITENADGSITFNLTKGTPTAISAVAGSTATAQQPVYNLAGQRLHGTLGQQQRGIYIVGGRKVVR